MPYVSVKNISLILYSVTLIEKGKDRRCVYEDGDMEDLSIAELETLAELLPKNQFDEDIGDDSKSSPSASKRKYDVTKCKSLM